MCPKLWLRETLRFKGNKTNWFSKGADEQFSSKLFEESFFALQII